MGVVDASIYPRTGNGGRSRTAREPTRCS
jgi:hypothetical protein